MASNSSKPYQYAQIRSVGFAVPDTLITTSAEAASEFVAQHGSVIYKSVSGVRSIVGELREGDIARLSEVRWRPTQLQERIAGVDVRVHVVGEELFACEVRSEAVDYRYAHLTGLSAQLTRSQLPDDGAGRCLALARATQLPLAGIDLRRTDEGEWYSFEINPSPGLTYYQNATGLPIDAAITKLLATPRPVILGSRRDHPNQRESPSIVRLWKVDQPGSGRVTRLERPWRN
jgi:glutathione synthase/RimK-type ligase-like ATP-grasp enzyme